MPSFQDSAVIFFLALLLFGPKKLPELARYVGKLMGEFRRASSEFRMQMEDEFRLAEQADQQKKIAAMQAAAPLPPPVDQDIPEPEHPHTPSAIEPEPGAPHLDSEMWEAATPTVESAGEPAAEPAPEPLPIASNGDLHMMPPSTGLPVSRSASHSLNGVFDSIPHASESAETPEAEAHTHG